MSAIEKTATPPQDLVPVVNQQTDPQPEISALAQKVLELQRHSSQRDRTLSEVIGSYHNLSLKLETVRQSQKIAAEESGTLQKASIFHGGEIAKLNANVEELARRLNKQTSAINNLAASIAKVTNTQEKLTSLVSQNQQMLKSQGTEIMRVSQNTDFVYGASQGHDAYIAQLFANTGNLHGRCSALEASEKRLAQDLARVSKDLRKTTEKK